MSEVDRAWTLTVHGFRQALRGRRLIGLAIIVLFPAGLALTIQQLAATLGPDELDPVLLLVGLGLVVPLVALLIGVSALREELESGTIVHLVTRPVRRETVLLSRLAASAGATIALSLVALTLPLAVMGADGLDAWSIAMQVAVLSSLAYTGLFALLGAVTKRAVLLGLVFLVAWEGAVASTPLVFSKFTVAYWTRSIVANQGDTTSGIVQDMLGAGAASTPTSVTVLVLVTLATAAAGAAWFGRREFAGAEPEE